MQLTRGLHNLQLAPGAPGHVVTIGNFDGLHLGHAAVIGAVVEDATRRDLPSCVISFEPLPEEYFAAAGAPARLMGLRAKYRQLARLGVDRLVVLRFDRRFSQMEPEAFVERVLVGGLGVRHLVVGDDFRFGRARRGDLALLCAAGERHGFEVSHTGTLSAGHARVSSTRIRELLAGGDLDGAAELLGRPYSICGRVARGQGLARKLGFPTANVGLGGLRPALSGVFAVHAGLDGSEHRGVANLGTRPTVDGTRTVLEVQLFDFDRDIYGRRLAVVFRAKLRDERRFESLEALSEQVRRDAEAARAYFERLKTSR